MTDVATRFGRDRHGASLMEFALMLPVMIALGVGGLELTNLTLGHQKIERLASTTADLFARNTLQPNERQVNDTFRAIDLMSGSFGVRDHGRVIVTGVVGAMDSRTGVVGNKIVWQRCDGSLSGQASEIGSQWATSNYADGPDVALPNGIVLNSGQMTIVSELSYQYQPWFSGRWFGGDSLSQPFRERSIQRTRGQAYTSITPITGESARRC